LQQSASPTRWNPAEGLSSIHSESDNFEPSIRRPEHCEPAWSFAYVSDPSTPLATNLDRGHVGTTEPDGLLRPGLGVPRVMLLKMQIVFVVAAKPLAVE
jgi:hypothetical protein